MYVPNFNHAILTCIETLHMTPNDSKAAMLVAGFHSQATESMYDPQTAQTFTYSTVK